MKTKARIITPTNTLKAKIGHGGIPDDRIQKAQSHIETAEMDFTPMASEFLQELGTELAHINAPPSPNMINAIMQLKGCGGMFRYQLISDVAGNALNFVETIEILNEDAAEVLQAHNNAIEIILRKKLIQDGGNEGRALFQELQEACERYRKKHPSVAA